MFQLSQWVGQWIDVKTGNFAHVVFIFCGSGNEMKKKINKFTGWKSQIFAFKKTKNQMKKKK